MAERLHFDCLKPPVIDRFLTELAALSPDEFLITGDISISLHLENHLGLLIQRLRAPVYFVLGNHDFYYGDFAQTNRLVEEVCQQHSNLIYLSNLAIVHLNDETVLIGHHGWGDGRAEPGDLTRSSVNDRWRISDLRIEDNRDYFRALYRLGNESAEYMGKLIPTAVQEARHVIVETHVPSLQRVQ